MQDQFDFSEALRKLKSGKRIARLGWNGKGMFLFLLSGNNVPKAAFQEKNIIKVVEDLGKDTVYCEASIRMFTANGTILTGWTPNTLDIFAEDWIEVV